MKPIAVLGAAFDPPHVGHWDSVHQVLPAAEQIWLLPSASHAFGKQLTPLAQRIQMLRLGQTAFAADAPVVISALEAEILAEQNGTGAVYTYPMLQRLQAQLNRPLRFVIGPDNAAPEVWARFYQAEALAREFKPWVVAERVQARSSLCRALLAQAWQGEISFSALHPLLGQTVVAYIQEMGLYRRP
jgi:nicotinate-nucleotide adenylyltransferase